MTAMPVLRCSYPLHPYAVLAALAAALLLPAQAQVAAPNTPMEKLKALAADTAVTPDLAEVALLASQLVRPSLDVTAYGQKLNELASELRPAMEAQAQPLEKAVAMAQFIYREKEFANSAVQTAEVFVGLDQVLDQKQWNCVGMALLYTALGKRLGLPIRPVAGYGHVLAAWDADPQFFIETTAAGALQPTRDYLMEYLPYPCVNPLGYVVLDERGAIAMTLTQMGLVMQRAERKELAASLFDLAIAFSDTYAEAHAGRGFLRAAANNHSAAVTDFERAVELDPDMREAYGGLGTSYRALGNLASAVGTYRTLVSLCPDDSTAVFNTGQLLYDTGDLAGAVQAFRHYIDLEPRDPEGYVRLAYPLEDGGDLPGAAEAYRQALQIAPNYSDAALNLAYLLEQMQNFDASMEGYRRVLQLTPGSAQAMGGIARILGKANRYDEALRAFRAALQQYPGAAFLWVDLGQLFEARQDLKQAIGAYQKAVEADPADPEAYFALARVLQQAGLNAEAQNVLAQAQAVEAAAADAAVARNLPSPFPGTEPGDGGVSDVFPTAPQPEPAPSPGDEEMEEADPGTPEGTTPDGSTEPVPPESESESAPESAPAPAPAPASPEPPAGDLSGTGP